MSQRIGSGGPAAGTVPEVVLRSFAKLQRPGRLEKEGGVWKSWTRLLCGSMPNGSEPARGILSGVGELLRSRYELIVDGVGKVRVPVTADPG